MVQRIHKLLPELMEETGYDMWIILCREYNEDPVFTTMLPSLCLTARRLSCLVFVKQGERFEALNFGRPSEHLNRVYTQGYTDSSRDQVGNASRVCQKGRATAHRNQLVRPSMRCATGFPNRCMISCIRRSTHRTAISCAAPTRWRCAGIETRTQEELSRYRTVYQLAMEICEEAFSRKVITPGVTTTTEVEEWIAQEINRLGLTFWFSPHVDVQRQGLDGVGSEGELIQHGDLLHYDVGIKYFGLCSDSQRLGYVLREDETEVPAYLQEAFAKTSRFQEIVSQEHITGRTGNEILKTCLERAQQEGIAAMLYCHPIGCFGHSAGTVVGLWVCSRASVSMEIFRCTKIPATHWN